MYAAHEEHSCCAIALGIFWSGRNSELTDRICEWIKFRCQSLDNVCNWPNAEIPA
ncbi:MAG: hypothetical protein RIR45_2008 [Pseudomonadota bacterium]|jgi:hypothetical protein